MSGPGRKWVAFHTPKNPSLMTCNPYRVTRRDQRNLHRTGHGCVCAGNSVLPPSWIGFRPNRVAARGMVTMRTSSKADGTRGEISASAVRGKPAKPPASKFLHTRPLPRRALRSPAGRARRPGTRGIPRESAGDHGPPIPPAGVAWKAAVPAIAPGQCGRRRSCRPAISVRQA